jgi:hypothetical protein
MQAMHETPVLTRKMIRDHFGSDVAGGVPLPFKTLAAAELADQVELIKISLQSLSAEEISKLWTAFGAHYRPTAAYQATVVLIEGRRPTKVALPVQKRNLYARTLREPVIDTVQSEAGPDAPITSTSKLVLLGRRLVGDDTEVVISGRKTTFDGPSATDARLVANLPAVLRAGVQAVQVKHKLSMGDPAPGTLHRAFESNVAAFVLQPTFTSLKLVLAPIGTGAYKGAATVVDIQPEVGRAQRIILMLNSKTTTPARAYAFVASPRTKDADAVVVPLEGVERGDYFVRVQVDGAESPVDLMGSTTEVKI